MSFIGCVPAVVCALICFAGYVYWDLIQLQVFSVLASNHSLHLVIDHGGLSDCSRCQHLPRHGLHSEGALGWRCTRPPRRPGRVVEMALFYYLEMTAQFAEIWTLLLQWCFWAYRYVRTFLLWVLILYRYASGSRLFFYRNNKKFEILLFLVFIKFEIII